ncbi:hypothetical protein GOBAR_AA12841 [Gossypium barbadense]|uniref:Uncharacterized protein n=1 Tax=Gossypium barbadense TaxID=3634 RepID=A0A2P5XWX9_GOSBA|nr:hypothetical protein GOBAR_AA12841 [Gossypium barbadense]
MTEEVDGNGSGSVAKWTLDFDSMTDEVDRNDEDQNKEIGIRDLKYESNKKQPNYDEMAFDLLLRLSGCLSSEVWCSS